MNVKYGYAKTPNRTRMRNGVSTGNVSLRAFTTGWIKLTVHALLESQTFAKSLRYLDRNRYNLDEFVVMPNHVHAIVTPRGEYLLSSIVHSWKSFTANKINAALAQSGAFWQKESFDHIVRSTASLEKFRKYIRDNPKSVLAKK